MVIEVSIAKRALKNDELDIRTKSFGVVLPKLLTK